MLSNIKKIFIADKNKVNNNLLPFFNFTGTRNRCQMEVSVKTNL